MRYDHYLSLSTQNFNFLSSYMKIWRKTMKSWSGRKMSIRTRTFSSFCATGAAYEQFEPICNAIRPLLDTFDPKFRFHKFIYKDIAKNNEISAQTKNEHLDQDFFFILCNGSCRRTIYAYLQRDTTIISHFLHQISIS